MIEAMLFGLVLGIGGALLDQAARLTEGALVGDWDELVRGFMVGTFLFGPPTILAWCMSDVGNWLVAVSVTWTVIALSSRDLPDWAGGA